jgi:hypothetical protein
MLGLQSHGMVGQNTNLYQGGQQKAMVVRDACPQCASQQCKKNGHIHTGKQNHCCKDCGRQFGLHPDNSVIDGDQYTLVERLLLEKISLTTLNLSVGTPQQRFWRAFDESRWWREWLNGFENACGSHLTTQLKHFNSFDRIDGFKCFKVNLTELVGSKNANASLPQR